MVEPIAVTKIDARFARFRARDTRGERRVLASMAKAGQRSPILVAPLGGRITLLDGHKRLRAARHLRLDELLGRRVEVDEVDALILVAKSQEARPLCPVEEGLVLSALHGAHGLTMTELSDRYERAPSFIQRRIALVTDFSETILDLVREGVLCPSVIRALFPVVRGDPEGAEALAKTCAEAALTSREAAALARAFIDAHDDTDRRRRLLADPRAFLLGRASVMARGDPRLQADARWVEGGLRALGLRADQLTAQLRSRAIHPLDDTTRTLLRAAWAESQPRLSRLLEAVPEVLA